MAEARNYWVATVPPDGRPHATPVWGLWVDRAFYFGAGPRTRKGRNLAENPASRCTGLGRLAGADMAPLMAQLERKGAVEVAYSESLREVRAGR